MTTIRAPKTPKFFIACFGLLVFFAAVSQSFAAKVAPRKKAAIASKATGATSDADASPKKDMGTDGVLDFEAEVIEGQRKRPDLFLQTEVQSLTLDAILYLRKDFNDYHQVESQRRPGYFEQKTRDFK